MRDFFSRAGSAVLLLPGFALAETIDFDHQVVPILKEHCAACHGGEEAEGGFSINTRDLFLDDDMAEPGNPEDSYFLQLITDPDPDYRMPPEEKSPVPAEQVAILEKWVAEDMPWTPGFTFAEQTYEPPLRPHRPELPPVTEGRDHPVDRIVDAYFAGHEIERPGPVSDHAFLRRVSLDLTGLPPTPDEIRAFVGDKRPDKRSRKIDELLADDIAYTEHWLTFWNDLLRNDYTGTGFITGGRKQISTWLYESLVHNKPFDQFTRELIAPPSQDSAGFIDGIEWRGNVSAGQTLPIQFSQSVSQSFLGINMKCASCHDSFLDRWTLDDAYGLAAIYSGESLDIHRCDKKTGETAQASWVFPELGDVDAEAPREQRLEQLASLMTHEDNGRWARTIVNRLWGQMMGRGIVHPLDAMQTEPWNEDLLDWLASDFQESGYDLRHTLHRIATSEIYQAETEHVGDAGEGDYLFRGPRPKRLTAEQFVDAVWQVTGTAPTSYDAPVVRGKVDPAETEAFAFDPVWIWGEPAKTGGPPPAGERLLFRHDFVLEKEVRSAGLVATADNSFTLYVNGHEVASGQNWTELRRGVVKNHLRKDNRILIAATNGGNGPNAAGAFAALRVVFTDGSERTIATGPGWTYSEKVPGGKANRWKLDQLEWKPATEVSVGAWEAAIDPRAGRELLASSAASERMVRASILKSDFLMRTLGRPNRDQIVTSRPSELTTLEALELSNNADLARRFEQGASRFGGTNWLEDVYLATLSRTPTGPERNAVLAALGDAPSPGDRADLLWSLCMSPEFFLVR